MTDIKQLLYISPQFPAVSLVFEQNEMLGIQNSGVNITIASCRNSSCTEAHEFAIPLLKHVIYPNYNNIFLGFVLLLFRSPISLLRILTFTLIASINILAIKKNLAALLFTLGWYPYLLNKEQSFDWIHADFGKGTATVALMLSEVLKCPFSFKVHAFDIYDKSLEYVDFLKKIKIKCAILIFSEHEYGKQKLLEISPKCEKKIKVNYTAIRPNDFQELIPVLTSKKFIALGRLVSKKGFDVLIKASAILNNRGENFVVDIYGYGLEEQNLKKLIKINNLQEIVNLKGKYKNEQLPEMLKDCIALVAPSVIDKNGDMDGIPTVIYEAMALGRAIITSKLSGIPEVIKENINGYLCEPGNIEELAEKMHFLLLNPHISLKMGIEGRKLVEKNHDYITNAKLLLNQMNNYV
ncbi:glycosyltransferase [Mastigocoleus testarum]|uniref:Glycosyl transferase family 1 domain-containing protein n=1 Tax=Mastigocoleus testarum BC008 TaxID=371196 RepID=A0A0V7ZNN7_9CYAN|nr:glycosyltransferase [Mastigocoleus testarum]KST66014.1 hypothetical protein BC008_23860 [Mastigocoleus testarum BC008]